MLKVEQRVDGGQLRLRDEVRGSLPQGDDSSATHPHAAGTRAAALLPAAKSCRRCWPACWLLLQESCMKNVKEAAAARAALGAYHPLWLRLGMEVVVGRTVAGVLPWCCPAVAVLTS